MPEAYPFEEIGTSEVMSEIILNELYQDGAVKFGIQDGWKVTASVSYHEWKTMTNGFYQIYPDQEAFLPGLSLNFFPQFQYEDLESWGGHQLHTLNLDTNFDLLHSEKFTTSTGFDGVVISGERNLTGLGSSQELLIMIDLTTPAWKERYDENEFADPDGWLGVMITSSGEDYSTVMSVVESIDFDESFVPEAYPFEEIGTSEVIKDYEKETPDNKSDINSFDSLIKGATSTVSGENWKYSEWLGYFWENPKTRWVFHSILGWLYIVSEEESSYWAYSYNLFSSPTWLWLKPNIFPYVYAISNDTSKRRAGAVEELEGLNAGESIDVGIDNSLGETNLRIEAGVIKNDFLEIDLGQDWSSTAIIDMGLGMITMTLSDNKGSQLILSSTYADANAFYLDSKLKSDEDVAKVLGTVTEKQYFVTESGYPGYALRYESSTAGLNQVYYKFGLDGTTDSYTGSENEWHSTTLTFTTSSMAGNTLSFSDAKAIANNVLFTEGTSVPGSTVEELEGLNAGESIDVGIDNSLGETNLRIEAGVIKNDFLEIDLGQDWSSTAIIDMGLGMITMTLSDNKGSQLILSSTYADANAFYLDSKLKSDEDVAKVLGTVTEKQYFVTESGYPGYALRYESSTAGLNQVYYKFGLDGTTDSYTGSENEWHSTTLTFTTSSMAGNTLSFSDAKAIANNVLFTEGTSVPRKDVSVLDGADFLPSVDFFAPTSQSPELSDEANEYGNEPDFSNGNWLYFDLASGQFTHWIGSDEVWSDWSKISFTTDSISLSQTQSTSEKYKEMEISTAVESIMSSSKADEEKKKELGEYFLGL